LDGEIKAAPSVGLNVAGFVEQFAMAVEALSRRSAENWLCFQSLKRCLSDNSNLIALLAPLRR
tara:strand:- start:21444 stop:21632 length:189 start_codon:yes stop_codon:yes gene_type:complete